MKQFIPFEDDWDALENLRLEDLIPYRVGFVDSRKESAHCAVSTSPSIFNTSPDCAPMRLAVPAESSST